MVTKRDTIGIQSAVKPSPVKIVRGMKKLLLGLGIEMLALAYTLPGVDAPAH